MEKFQKEIGWIIKEKYNCKPTKDLNKDIKRLEKGEPIDYVIGFVDFLNCRIDLSKKPLIPRTETEFWVQEAIKDIKGKKSPKVLDIFSGSGCIGLAVLKNIKNAKVDFSEKEKKFIGQIKINIRLNKITKGRSKVIEGDVFSKIKGKYDYILSNPPYIAETRKSKVQESALKFEPRGALFGGEDGLKYIRIFLKEASGLLNKGGKIYMEFDYIQTREIKNMLKEFRYSKFSLFKDQFSKTRFLVAEN